MATGELSPSVIRGVNTRQLNNTTMANRSVIELLRNMLKAQSMCNPLSIFLNNNAKKSAKNSRLWPVFCPQILLP